MNDLKTDSFGTHRPILCELLKITRGNIIELGCGNSSTKLINSIISNSDRKLISLDPTLNGLISFQA